MKFLVPNYSCLQNPCLGGYRPRIPVLSVRCLQLNLLNPHPSRKKIPGYATGVHCIRPIAESSDCCMLRPAVTETPCRLQFQVRN